MSTEQTNRKTISWIKQEIEHSMKEIHDATDLYSQNLNDPSPLESCAKTLNNITGVLNMINIHGAHLLAYELEQLARALSKGEVKQKKQAAEVLASGMLQLPGYLESLYQGQRDMPLVLLPQINDIRAVQQRELLTEGEFFSPNMSAPAPIQKASKNLVSGEPTLVARKLRPGYLKHLLEIVRDQNVQANAEQLYLILNNLLCECLNDYARQLWWTASGIAVSLQDDALENSVAVKLLLAQVDRNIKHLIDEGEDYFIQNFPEKLIKNILYYISQSKTYHTRITEIKNAFGINYPDVSTVDQAREALYGFNVDLADTLFKQVKDELAIIKDILDIAMRSKEGATAQLKPLLVQFSAIGDALGMLGMNKVQQVVVETKNFLTPKINSGEKLEKDELMELATALLHVELSLNDLNASIHSDYDSDIPDSEIAATFKKLAKEIIANIKSIKDKITEYIEIKTNTAPLVEALQLTEQIQAAMQISKQETHANLAKAVCDYMRQELIEKQVTINSYDLELLANAFVGIEYYYESILEISVAPELGMQIANESMKQLGYKPEPTQWEITHGNALSALG